VTRRLRIAEVGPVATSVPPAYSSSVELVTSLLTEGLVAQGHEVTLFATGASRTSGRLHATFARGYGEDPSLWPWELCELFNLAAAIERAADFDVIHYQAMYAPMSLAFTRLSPTPVVQTLHHAPGDTEVELWRRYPEAPFVAISAAQARRLAGLNVVATVHHAVDAGSFVFRAQPDDYLLFLGRFTREKGVLEAIEIARQAGMRLLLAAAENDYYRDSVAPLVDGHRIVYVGEAGHAEKVALLGGARALLYPLQSDEPFGLVVAEAMMCGTPVAALARGAVEELIVNGVSGGVFAMLDELIAGLPRVMALDRARVHAAAADRVGVGRMVAGYIDAFTRVIEARWPSASAHGRTVVGAGAAAVSTGSARRSNGL
jgi:glycosyltransferase involved in cell wall biosynthesis